MTYDLISFCIYWLKVQLRKCTYVIASFPDLPLFIFQSGLKIKRRRPENEATYVTRWQQSVPYSLLLKFTEIKQQFVFIVYHLSDLTMFQPDDCTSGLLVDILHVQ